MVNYQEEINEYCNNLFHPTIGKDARKYLYLRNITPNTVKFWKLGFSPLNYNPKCYQNERFDFWRKLNGRITIPVYDQNGDIVSISGRSIYPEIQPKYHHYQCSTTRILFGLYQNKKEIMNQNVIIFTEGQLDVISAWQHGLKVCASTFGSHFSNEQFAIASRYTNQIGILYDNDDAGTMGALSSLEKNNIYGDMQIKIINNILNKNEDLDNWIQHNDFHKIINEAKESEEDKLQKQLVIQIKNTRGFSDD